MTGEIKKPSKQRALANLWVQAAHDLLQPVQAALLLVKTLDGSSSRVELVPVVHHLEAALESLREMLDILNLLARIENRQRNVQLGTCELGDLVKSPIPILAAIAAERGIPLRFRNMRGLVRTNPKLCVTAIRSLVINAIDLADGGEIFVGCRRHGGQLMLEVRFRGASLDGASKRSAFVRLPPRREAPGAGELALGLGLLEHLCKQLGHSLRYTRLALDQQLLAMGMPLAVCR